MIAAVTTNEDVLREWLAAGDRGDLATFDRYLHPDVVVHAPLGLSSKGIDAEKRVWADARRAVPDICHTVQESMTIGTRSAARVVVSGTLVGDFAGIEASGRSFELDQVVWAHFDETGLIVEAWEIADTGSLLRELEADDVATAK